MTDAARIEYGAIKVVASGALAPMRKYDRVGIY